MNDDAALLRRYADEKSDAAFAEFAQRRVGVVYAVALRKVGGDTHLAEDVTQRVFAEVAKSAATLAHHPLLAGWLFKSTHYLATQVVRAERRRKVREEKAEIMNHLLKEEGTPPADWDRLRPLLDDLVNELGDRDRAAVLWRFFESQSFAEIGTRLQLSEAGARSRVERAVEKLHCALAKRGVTSTAIALSGALASQAGAAAPSGLAASVTGAALAGAAGLATPSALLVFMSATKTAFTGSALLSVTGLLLLSSVGVASYEAQSARAAETTRAMADARLQTESAALARLKETAQAAQIRLASAQSRLAELRAARTAPKAPAAPSASSVPAGRDPRADGQTLLAAIGEAGRNDIRELMRRQFHTGYALTIREAGLTPEQASAFEAHLVQYGLDHLFVTSTGISPDPDNNELPPDELRSIFGEEAFLRWQNAERKDEAYDWVTGLSLRINGEVSATPLTIDQLSALAGMVASHSNEFRDGGKVDPATVDWDAVGSDARRMLSPAQWRQAQAWLLKQEVEREITALKTKEPSR